MKPYFERGGITIYLGDCREVLPTLEGVDHVITDPPYLRDVYLRMRKNDSAGGNRMHKIRDESALISMRLGSIGAMDAELAAAVSCDMARLTKRWAVIFSDAESTWLWRQSIEEAGMRYVRTGAWVKPDAMPQMTGDRPGVGFEPCTIGHAQGAMRWNGGGHPALWTHNICKGAARPDHPCPKPLPLMLELVSLFTDAGDFILDPFGGSMTTAVAALQLGRRCIAIELDEAYCEAGAKRLEAMDLPMFPGLAFTKQEVLPL